MSIKFFSTQDEKIESAVQLEKLHGAFMDRAVDRLNRAYNESKKEFDFERKQQYSKLSRA